MVKHQNKEETLTQEEQASSNCFEIATLVSMLERQELLTKGEVIEEIKRRWKS
jgi:hypothetical protein